jgi:hypothetical protein
LIGLPRVVFDMLLKRSTSPDWLVCSGKFITMPAWSHYPIPVVGVVIAFVGAFWVFTRRRDLIHLWATGVAGLLLYNSQFVSRIMIENYHWMYVWGPFLSLLMVLLVASPLEEGWRWAGLALRCLAAIVVLDVAAGC